MVATAEKLEFQVTLFVRSFVIPLAYVPVAVNCWFEPEKITGFCGAILIESKRSSTTSDVDLVTGPERAEIVVVPTPIPTTNPPLLAVATEGSDEFHVTELVKSSELPSSNIPVATNC